MRMDSNMKQHNESLREIKLSKLECCLLKVHVYPSFQNKYNILNFRKIDDMFLSIYVCRGDLQKDFLDTRNLARDRQQKIAELNAVSSVFFNLSV